MKGPPVWLMRRFVLLGHRGQMYSFLDINGRLTNRFCYGKRFWHVWGGGGGWEVGVLHKSVSQILAIIDFFNREITGKTLSARRNIIGNITEPNKSFKLGQTWRRQLHS